MNPTPPPAAPPPPPHLFALRPEELVALAQAQGMRLPLVQARRVLVHVLSEGRDDLDLPGQPLSRATRAWLGSHLRHDRLAVEERVRDDGDGSVRYLLRSPDGALHEAVRIPLHKAGAFSVCLSSQVGCAMGCAFCATGRLGLRRHLEAWEMVAAWRLVRDEVVAQGLGRVTGAVFMGQGEPFHNYDAVIRAADQLGHPCGGRIGGRAITISTVGLVPQIRRYTAEGHRFRLIVSLTSARAERRAALLPVAGKWSLEELAQALRAHHEATRQRVTIAMVVLGGVNTGDDEVQALRALLGDLPVRINLVDVNAAEATPDGFRRATDAERRAFMDGLAGLGQPVVRRYSVGQEQQAACGMLAATRAPALVAEAPEV
ncbi:radical SAM protein [Myxococcota bacterium]|nr:radical SAM protein [Myxococcota bacterium]